MQRTLVGTPNIFVSVSSVLLVAILTVLLRNTVDLSRCTFGILRSNMFLVT